jgi:subtilisin family serine protease
MFPSTHRSIWCLLVFGVLVAIQTVPFANQQSTSGTTLSTVSDLIVTGDARGRRILYVTDPITGAVYSHELTELMRGRVEYSDFHLFFKSDELSKPSAIGFLKDKLLIYDQATSAIYELDPKTATTQVVLKDKQLTNADTVALSTKGDVAFAKNHSIIAWYSPDKGFRVIDFDFKQTQRLVFSGSNLLVINVLGEVFRVEPSHLTVAKITAPNKLVDQLGRLKELATFLNIFYCGGESETSAFAQNSVERFRSYDLPIPLLFNNTSISHPDRIFVTQSKLLIAQDSSKSILQMPRPVPVDIEFDGDQNQTTAALIVLYQYLYNLGMLSTRLYESAEKSSIEKLLMDQQVILASIPDSQRGTRNSIGKLICDLNKDFCANHNVSVESVIREKINQGEKLLLPTIPHSEHKGTALITLTNKTVEQYLSNIFPSKEQFREYVNNELLKDNPPSITDKDGYNILKQKGPFRLPVLYRSTSILVSADDIQKENATGLQNQLQVFKTYLFSKQNLAPKLASSSLEVETISPLVLNETPESVKENRSNLKKQIHFLDADSANLDLSGVVIGVAERFGDVDFNHPAFVRADNESIWFDLPPDGSDMERRRVPAGMSVPSITIGDQFVDSDHGTHVAGLIASRPDSLTPGLLSDLKGLVLLDSSNPAALNTLVDRAIAENIFIFNFSFTLSNEAAAKALKTSMTSANADRLFIVAAGKAQGGENEDLEQSADVPIKWTSGTRNLIGVSAVIPVDGSGVFWMEPFIDENGETQPGAKFGKKYVQIVAPGKDVYSLARGNSFKRASGSSQSVPQVTAAAAMLFAQKVTQPALIKARLMYTSDWSLSFTDRVYGGMLNVHRAVWEPTLDLLATASAPLVPKSMSYDGNPTITILSGQIEFPDGPTIPVPLGMKLKLNQIFRIAKQPGGANLVRVFYYDDNRRLRILKDAILNGTINCKSLRTWDSVAKKFGDATPCSSIDLSDVSDFVADIRKVPTGIGF